MAASIVTASLCKTKITSGSSIGLTYGATPTTGNVKSIAYTGAVSGATAPTVSSITGGGGESFTKTTSATGSFASADGVDTEIWSCPNCANGTSATINMSGALSGTNPMAGGWGFEIQLVPTSSVVDQSGGTNNSNTSPSKTPSQSGDAWVAASAGYDSSAKVTAPSSGWTDAGAFSNGTNPNVSSGDAVYTNEAGSGAEQATFQGGTNGAGAVIVGYKPLAAPTAATGVSASVSGANIVLNWTNGTGQTDILVRRSTSPGGESAYADLSSSSSTTYTDTGCTAGTTYYYKIREHNAAGDTDSSEVSATVPAWFPTGHPPNVAVMRPVTW